MMMLLEQTIQDLRLGCRRLIASPVFTTFSVLALALGIGATTAVYSAMRSLDFKPIDLPNADTVAFVTSPTPVSFRWTSTMSRSDLAVVRERDISVTGLAATALVTRPIATGQDVDVALGEAVTGAYFTTARASALI